MKIKDTDKIVLDTNILTSIEHTNIQTRHTNKHRTYKHTDKTHKPTLAA